MQAPAVACGRKLVTGFGSRLATWSASHAEVPLIL
jgi:hypothetical protein